MYDFSKVDPVKACAWLVLPTVYDESLSYGEQLNKFCKALNELIENNNNIPDYVASMIQQYITSGAIDEVVRNILANYILNVKYPPKGITPAVGDGSADDTSAIQGCIDYAFAQGGGCVYFPFGKYLTKSINLKSGVSLIGFDRYSTKIVQRGGDTKPLLTGGNVQNVQVSNLTLDGNNEVQTDDLDVINILGKDVLLTNLVVKSGYQCLVYSGLGGDLQVTDVVFGGAVKKVAVISGRDSVQMENVKFNELGKIQGECVLDVSSNSGVYRFSSKAVSPVCVKCSGSRNTFVFDCENANSNFEDSGQFNNFDVLGVEKKEQIAGNINSTINNNLTTNVKGNINFNVTGNREIDVDGFESKHVDGVSSVNIGGARTEIYGNSRNLGVTGINIEEYHDNMTEKFNSKHIVNGIDETRTYNNSFKVVAPNLILDSIGNPIQLGMTVEDQLYFGKIQFKESNGNIRKFLVENNGTKNLENKSSFNALNTVIIGDSFAGTWYDGYQSYAYQLKDLLKIDTLHVYSIGGAGFIAKGNIGSYSNVNYQEFLDAEYSNMQDFANDVTLVIIQGGGNDYKQEFGNETTAVKNLISDIKSKFPNAEIYGISGFWLHNMFSDTKKGITRGFNESGVTLFPNCFYTFLSRNEYFLEDKLHPNKLGMQIMSKAIANNILHGISYDCTFGGFISATGGGAIWEFDNDGNLNMHIECAASSSTILSVPKYIQPSETQIFGIGYCSGDTGNIALPWYINGNLNIYIPGKTPTGNFIGDISWKLNANNNNSSN